jgi:hypothetical protein
VVVADQLKMAVFLVQLILGAVADQLQALIYQVTVVRVLLLFATQIPIHQQQVILEQQLLLLVAIEFTHLLLVEVSPLVEQLIAQVQPPEHS